jgi:hypothetical protein
MSFPEAIGYVLIAKFIKTAIGAHDNKIMQIGVDLKIGDLGFSNKYFWITSPFL